MGRSLCLRTVAVLLICAMTATDSIGAEEIQPPLMSDREWTETVKVWMARAMVSEAGFEETQDHIAIAYVLHRRWQQVRRRYPGMSMTRVIAQYCAGFGKTIYSRRQAWVVNLKADGSRPEKWPDDLAWRDYKDRWMAVLNTADEWRLGRYPDPCRGLSRYWGGPMDKPSARMIRMDCGETKNFFYTVKTLLPETN